MLADLRLALRALRRAPGLVAAAVLTIALGVSANANAVAFAWFKGIALDPLALAPAVRRALAAVEPGLPPFAPTTLARWSESASFVPRIAAAVMVTLGAVVLVLAAVGLYAVTAYAVARRTREIGVRVALGAAAAFAAARLVGAQLYGVSPADPATYAAAAGLLLAVALAAAWVPARRAARVDPTEALRAE